MAKMGYYVFKTHSGNLLEIEQQDKQFILIKRKEGQIKRELILGYAFRPARDADIFQPNSIRDFFDHHVITKETVTSKIIMVYNIFLNAMQ